jgi:integrase
MRGKGEGSVFKDSRGLWTIAIELPSHDGTRRRKVLRSKDKKVLLRKLDDLKAELRKSGDLPTRDMTVEAWMHEWFATICLPKVRPKTAQTYRGLIDREILPAIGAVKLDKLSPADVRKMLKATTDKGLSSTTAAQVHRILSVALKYAIREGKVARNVASLTDAPRRAATNLSALTVAESIKVLETVKDDRLGSLWAAVLLTGARQGELLGLELNRVTDVLDLSWQLQRITWDHGCKPTKPCGNKRGAECPARKITVPADFEHRQIAGGLWWTRPKSKAGWRIIPLVEPLRSIVEARIAVAASEPNPHGLLWTMPDGSPIDPHVVSKSWDTLLKRAEVSDVRFHDGRHTTVDLLLAAGVPEDLIMEIVGHSTRAMTRSYKTRGNQPRLVAAMKSLSAFLNQPDGAHSETPEEAA